MGATDAELSAWRSDGNASFRRLASRVRPDRFQTPLLKERAHAAMLRLNAARAHRTRVADFTDDDWGFLA